VIDKKLIYAIIGLLFCWLVFLTSALFPALSGDGSISYYDFFPVMLVSALTAAGLLTWIVAAWAKPSWQWLIPIGIVASWGIIIGALTIFSNQAGISFCQSQLMNATERAEHYRSDAVREGKDAELPESYVQQQRDTAQVEIERCREDIQRHQSGRLMGAVFLLVGLASAIKFALMMRRRRLIS
jgi:type VI protein secretion system component VasK